MADFVTSVYPNMGQFEAEYASFLVNKIEKYGEAIHLQHITGHLSQLNPKVREAIGGGRDDLRNFVDKYPALFTINEANKISVRLSPKVINEPVRPPSRYSESSEVIFPEKLNAVEGVVIKTHPTFGFISIKKPIKTEIYFTPYSFSKGKSLLSELGVFPGKKIVVNAVQAKGKGAGYRAVNAWFPAKVENEVIAKEGFKARVPKERQYDADSSEGSGTVQKVFKAYGFIMIEDDPQNTVFFTKDHLVNAMNIMDLSKVFFPGDIVQYKAIRSPKNVKARWSATKVWVKRASGNKLAGTEASSVVNAKDSREKICNVFGKIFCRNNGVVIKFGEQDKEIADADSCPFYVHSNRVQDVSWEFTDDDIVEFDAVKIKSFPGWKAVLGWVGTKPDVPEAEITEDSYLADESSFSELSKAAQRLPEIRKTEIHSSASSQISPSSSYSKSVASIDDVDSEETNSSISGNINSHHSSGKKRSRSRRYNENNFRGGFGRGRSIRGRNYNQFHRKDSNSEYEWNMQKDSGVESEKNYVNNVPLSRSSKTNSQASRSKATSAESLCSDDTDVRNYLKIDNKHTNWADCPYSDEESRAFSDARGEQKIEHTDWGDCPYSDEESRTFSDAKGEQKMEDYYEVCYNSDAEIDNECNAMRETLDLIDLSSEIGDELNDRVPPRSELTHLKESRSFCLPDTQFNGAKEDIGTEDEENASQERINETATDSQSQFKPYVKHFQNLVGELLKVYCRYAIVKNDQLRQPASFFVNDFYQNGKSIMTSTQDLNEALKVGQKVMFNCIEVLDEEGSFFQKPTLAWTGQKPNIKEITPREYITENDLKITIADEEIQDLNQIQKPCTTQKSVMPQKFLTLDTNNDDLDSAGGIEYQSEFPSKIEKIRQPSKNVMPPNFLTVETSTVNSDSVDSSDCESELIGATADRKQPSLSYLEIKEKVVESIRLSSHEELIEAVSKLLITFKHSQVNLTQVSTDIVDLILKSQNSFRSVTAENPITVENDCERLTAGPQSLNKEMTSSAAQTILTGNVIATSIFPI